MGYRIALVLCIIASTIGCSESGPQPAQSGKKMLICPSCKLEYAYSDTLVGKPCLQCGPKAKPLELAVDGERDIPTWQKGLAVGVVAMVLLQGGLLLVLKRRSFWRADVARRSDPILHCRCPFCRRKYKYPTHRSGQGVVCRQCKTAFVYPSADLA